MARSLRSLVRLHDYEVDQKRRELAVLISAVNQLEDRARKFEVQIIEEKKVAAAAPAIAGFHYGRFAQVIIDRRKNFARAIAEAEAKVAEGMERLHDAYRDHKKYETAEANREKVELAEDDRRGQLVLDEVALQSFLIRESKRRKAAPRRWPRATPRCRVRQPAWHRSLQTPRRPETRLRLSYPPTRKIRRTTAGCRRA
ncbi:MAG: hypothetical protein EXQ90_08430 [Rhodospirillales bacterium]|nr:hypothetical protein [Rhodospirillales bacterium]